ncbi:hypothetical protein R3I94_001464 [Phoxinus phoxinus]
MLDIMISDSVVGCINISERNRRFEGRLAFTLTKHSKDTVDGAPCAISLQALGQRAELQWLRRRPMITASDDDMCLGIQKHSVMES